MNNAKTLNPCERKGLEMDLLTGVFNHATIRNVLKARMEYARRKGKAVAVLIADLDRFKEANDTYGRSACDEILKDVAARIKGEVDSKGGVVGRYGGDEFLIIKYDYSLQKAVDKADAIRKAIGEKSFRVGENELCKERIWGTVSLGVAANAHARKSDEVDEDSLIRCAGAALCQAKNNGRNRVEAFKIL